MNTDKPQLEGTKLNNFTPLKIVPELQIIDIQEGTGEVVEGGSTGDRRGPCRIEGNCA